MIPGVSSKERRQNEAPVGEGKPSRPLKILLERFFELGQADQLQAFGVIREYLAAEAPAQPKIDKVIEERRLALEAIRSVVDDLGLGAGQAPTQEQFKVRAPSVAPGWSVRRVREAFGSWRSAGVAIANRGVPPTAARQAIRQARAPNPRSTEDYLVGIREWLATNPAKETGAVYELWRKERNERLRPGDRAVVSASPIRNAFDLSWKGIIATARGETDEAELTSRKQYRPRPKLEGPHGLISFRRAATVLGMSISQARYESRLPDFPKPALTHARNSDRLWRRSDIEAYRDEQPFPKRRENELGSLYLDSAQIAERYGVKVKTTQNPTIGRPPPTIHAGRARYWLRSEVEDFDRRRQLEQGSSWG